MKNGREVASNNSWNVIGDSSDETNFPYKSLLTDTQVLRLHKAVVNNSLANITLLKFKLSKMVHLQGFLDK